MSERERWIVYPLLFLALGASLRDKIIKTTESQRIRCQGLMVYDERENKVVALFGPEHFPEYLNHPGVGEDFINVGHITTNAINAEKVQSKVVQTNRLLGPPLTIGDTGAIFFPLWNWMSELGDDPGKYLQKLQQRAQQQAERRKETPSQSPSSDEPPAAEPVTPSPRDVDTRATDDSASEETRAEPPAAVTEPSPSE